MMIQASPVYKLCKRFAHSKHKALLLEVAYMALQFHYRSDPGIVTPRRQTRPAVKAYLVACPKVMASMTAGMQCSPHRPVTGWWAIHSASIQGQTPPEALVFGRALNMV
jgi:hypothetical protein